MRRARPVRCGLAAALAAALLMATPAAAQSLADVARKEQARREAVQAPGKAYTNGDLTPDRTGAPTVEAQAAGAPSGLESEPGDEAATPGPPATDGDAPAVESAPEEPVLDEAYWRRQSRALRGRVEKASAALAVVSGPSEGNERQQAKVAELKASAEGVLARAESALEAFEREARTLGVPDDWMR